MTIQDDINNAWRLVAADKEVNKGNAEAMSLQFHYYYSIVRNESELVRKTQTSVPDAAKHN
jgi:hypothetical protein